MPQAPEVALVADLGFGIFEPLLRDSTAYLSLLNLGDAEATQAISLVVKYCASASNPYQDICLLLRHTNWRPHLVAAVAIATLAYDPAANHELWTAIDTGSWVTPQLAAVAWLRDPAFAEHARDRLRSGCRVDSSRSAGLSPPERHSSTGPGGSVERSAKTAASLIRLLRLLPRDTNAPIEDLPSDVITLANKDIDASGTIAERWLMLLKRDLADLGFAPGAGARD